MSANLLTLNSSKTEFLLIGLKQQLAKTESSFLDTTHSARNLGFVFEERLTFSDQISALSKSCYSILIHALFNASVLTLTLTQLVLLPLQLFITNLITVTLCTTIFLTLNYVGSN